VSNHEHTEFFDEAGAAVGQLAGKVSHMAGLFRGHELQEANGGLAVLAGELRDVVVMISVMQGPLGVEPDRLTIEGVSPDEQIARLGGWLESLVAAQGSDDWLTVADILEYDLEPVLRAWTGVLRDCAAAERSAVERGLGPKG
jgi:hypothetical protein